VDFVDDFNP
jgi:hypothetical protein